MKEAALTVGISCENVSTTIISVVQTEPYINSSSVGIAMTPVTLETKAAISRKPHQVSSGMSKLTQQLSDFYANLAMQRLFC